MSNYQPYCGFKTKRTLLLPKKLWLGAALLLLIGVQGWAQAAPQMQPWTLESVRQHLLLYPDDSYAQFVALQLSRRAGPKEVQATADFLSRRDRLAFRRQGRRADIDLLNFTSGALAVQESLQLDTMTAGMIRDTVDPIRRGRRNQQFNGTTEDRQQLQQIALALLNYESTHRHLPTSASVDKSGKPLLSWRVHVLPYLEQGALYDQFRLNEPWDSPHNKKLISKIPDVFRASNTAGIPEGKTTYLVPSGKGTVFDGQRGVRLAQIIDGTSNTLMLLQVTADNAVPWTKPQDVKVDLKKPLEGIFSGDANWVDAAMVDGSVLSLPKSMDDKAFGSLLKRDDRQVLDWQAVYRDAPPRVATQGKPGIAITTLKGPTTKSHPFAEMLGDSDPNTSELANWVPSDFYFVHSRSLTKLLSIANDYEAWSAELLRHAFARGQESSLIGNLINQLGLDPKSQAMRQLEQDTKEVAVVGSDLYLQDGNDVTLIIHLESNSGAPKLLDQELIKIGKRHASAEILQRTYSGIVYTQLTTPDRSLHAYSASPRPDIMIRSNSLVALKRVLDGFADSDGSQETRGYKSLGQTDELRYVRTIFEYGADEEDVLIYMSDPFIRQLMGPSSKITELRRRRCNVHLRMIHYATLLYQSEHGTQPTSIEQLVRTECLPEGFLDSSIPCPDGGEYGLTTEGHQACCSHHGCVFCMKPGCETVAQHVTFEEKQLYAAFLAEYNEYWRTFFDPIAVRIQHAPESSRVETLILPLLDNSIYTAAAEMLGGNPASISHAPATERVVLSMGATFKAENLFEFEARPAGLARLNTLKQIALAVHKFASVHRHLPPAADKGSQLSWRVHILPYLGEQALYDRFRLDEPWDSEHNKALLKNMPGVYGDGGTNTRILGFEDKGVLNNRKPGLEFRNMSDGLSDTLLAVEAGPERAVPWTKPEDLSLDSTDPLASLGTIGPDGLVVAFADGRAAVLPSDLSAKDFLAYVTYNGREVIQIDPTPPRPQRVAIRTRDIHSLLSSLGIPGDDIERLDVGGLVQRGLGNHLSFHVYDAEPAFSFNSLRFAGQLMADQSGWLRSEFLFVLPLVNSLNSPVYIACSLDDPTVVDEFLNQLDGMLAAAARSDTTMPVELDFYKLTNSEQPVWCIAWDIFGFRVRAFYTRVGDHLVIASQPDVIEDLIRSSSGESDGASSSSPGHVQLQILPQHWARIMKEMQLTWGEAAREVCLHNLGPINSAARLTQDPTGDPRIAAQQAFGATYSCPCGGSYHLQHKGQLGASVHCSFHGDAVHPQQSTTVPEVSTAAKAVSTLGYVDAVLTFTEHGLQAVFEIHRRKSDD